MNHDLIQKRGNQTRDLLQIHMRKAIKRSGFLFSLLFSCFYFLQFSSTRPLVQEPQVCQWPMDFVHCIHQLRACVIIINTLGSQHHVEVSNEETAWTPLCNLESLSTLHPGISYRDPGPHSTTGLVTESSSGNPRPWRTLMVVKVIIKTPEEDCSIKVAPYWISFYKLYNER